MPGPRTRQRTGTIISLIAHALLLTLLLRPEPLNTDPNLVEIQQGGGGPGPAGGGGGGTGGTGGVRFVKLTPPPPPSVTPPPTPQLVIEPPKPVIPEPVLPQIEMPKLAQEPKVEIKVQSPIIGAGGGSGRDGTTGNGPGTGGGVGSGIGTGRGSGVGPGTGGGDLTFYPAMMTEMFIPPLPAPAKVRGFQLIVNFDIDERGKIIDVIFTPTKDKDYNKKLNDILRSFKFLPGTTLDGVPIRVKYQMTYGF